jgi:hypothetical protein
LTTHLKLSSFSGRCWCKIHVFAVHSAGFRGVVFIHAVVPRSKKCRRQQILEVPDSQFHRSPTRREVRLTPKGLLKQRYYAVESAYSADGFSVDPADLSFRFFLVFETHLALELELALGLAHVGSCVFARIDRS